MMKQTVVLRFQEETISECKHESDLSEVDQNESNVLHIDIINPDP